MPILMPAVRWEVSLDDVVDLMLAADHDDDGKLSYQVTPYTCPEAFVC